MTTIAEVVPLYETNCRSIPDMLRQAAESIEQEDGEDGPRTKAMIAVQVLETGEVQIYGWGDTNDFHALGALQMGINRLSRDILEAQDEDS